MAKRKAKPYHHGDLREKVLELALVALEKRPPEELSLRDLARQAGVTTMALYRHFAGRDALLSALAVIGFDDLGRRVQAIDQMEDARAALSALGVAYVRFAIERPGLFRLMYGGKVPETPVKPGQPPHATYAALSRRITELAKPAEVGVAFLASWSLVHGLATLLVTDRIRQPVQDPVALAERVCTFFVGAFD
jgi:AcrR family transcriptional regulator